MQLNYCIVLDGKEKWQRKERDGLSIVIVFVPGPRQTPAALDTLLSVLSQTCWQQTNGGQSVENSDSRLDASMRQERDFDYRERER